MRSQTPSLTACLLAGGKSSRMGRDKAGVEFFEKPLWRHQLETLQQLDAAELLISGRSDACYSTSGLPIILDEFTNAGPLSGVASLLGASVSPLVLVLAVDMPFMTAEFLANLESRCSTNCGIVPELNGFFEGVSAIFPKIAHSLALEVLCGEDHSMQHFITRCVADGLLKISSVGHDEAALFQSLNSPADVP